VNLGDNGNSALFVSGNYLKADLTISWQVSTPDGQIVIDYTFEEKNKDGWNAVVGASWDSSKRWSIMAEYNGFIGSRETFTASLARRF
jgi:opacity protein-like surface antigen